MLNDTHVEVLPAVVLAKHWRLAEEFTVNGLNSWPTHQFLGDETLDQVAEGLSICCPPSPGEKVRTIEVRAW